MGNFRFGSISVVGARDLVAWRAILGSMARIVPLNTRRRTSPALCTDTFRFGNSRFRGSHWAPRQLSCLGIRRRRRFRAMNNASRFYRVPHTG